MLAFSVFNTLPRNGKIAWNLRSRPCLAEPPAESPSTRKSSFFLALRPCAGVNLPDNRTSLRFPLAPRDASRALRAASLASRAFKALRTSICAVSPFSIR